MRTSVASSRVKSPSKPKKEKKDMADIMSDFLQVWGPNELIQFLEDILLFFELYDVEDKEDWVETRVGADNASNVRLARTIYLLSKFCEHHSSRMVRTNIQFRELWLKMEKITKEVKESSAQGLTLDS